MKRYVKSDISFDSITRQSRKAKTLYKKLLQDVTRLGDELDSFNMSATFDDDKYRGSYADVYNELIDTLQQCTTAIESVALFDRIIK